MVRLHRHRHGRGAGSGRLADRTCFLALGLLHQCAHRGGRHCAFTLARPESKSTHTASVDWAGALIVTAGLAGVAYGFIESASLGWSNLRLGEPCRRLRASAGFLLLRGSCPLPMVPLSLFRSRDFTGANFLTFFLYAALGIFFFLFPLNLIQVQHYSATATGAAALPLHPADVSAFALVRRTGR